MPNPDELEQFYNARIEQMSPAQREQLEKLQQKATEVNQRISEIHNSEGVLDGLRIVIEQINKIPAGTDWHANRYDTDTEHVIHIWRDGESYDIRTSKKEYLR